MPDKSFPESKLEWLLEKFKNRKGEITASDIREKGDKKYSNSDWRKLMSLAVQKGHAKDNGKYSKNDKYGICMAPAGKVFFDRFLLDLLLYQPLLPSATKEKLSDEQRDYFDVISCRWCDVVGAFIRHNSGEEVDLHSENEFLNALVSIRAKEYICLYKVIELGWPYITEKITGLQRANYNLFFLEVLRMHALLEFTKAISENSLNPTKAYRSQHKRMTFISNESYDLSEAKEFLGEEKYGLVAEGEMNIFSKSSFIKEVMRESDITIPERILLYHWITIGDVEAALFVECFVIKEILAESENPQIKESLEDLRRAINAREDNDTKQLRDNSEKEFLYRQHWPKADD
jgi:hypothetical protein